MRRVFVVIVGIMSLVAGIIVLIMGMVNHISTGNPFGHGGVFYVPDLRDSILMFLNCTGFFILSSLGGLVLLMPRKMMRKRGQPEPAISDMRTTLKAYRIGGALCIVGGILAIVAYDLFGTGEGFFMGPLVTTVGGIIGLLSGFFPHDKSVKNGNI